MRAAAVVVLMALAGLCGAVEARAAQLRLSWDDNSPEEAGFSIERRSSPEDPFVEVATTGADVTALDDVTVAEGVQYCYRVSAFNDTGRSSPSNEACAVAGPFSPLPLLKLNLFSAPPGRGMILTATLTPGALPLPVDAYVVVVLPDGALISIDASGAAVPGLVPRASGVLSTSSTVELVRYVFTGGEPGGSYTWYGAVTEAGTFTVIGDVAVQTFHFSP